MSYLVLARKWRPGAFDEVVGQEHVTRTLKNALTQDRVAHALLFTGSRGVGKTTCARILAKALNCANGPTIEPCGRCGACVEITTGSSVDVFEIDGASNNSVDQIREIRESVKFLPTRGKRKMYIIDEVHMLSTSAFNALLKTLEEPPAHVLFVFATTEPHKIPETILSRCQRFDFKRIPETRIVDAIAKIAAAEGIRVETAALHHIAREAQGGMRDSLSLLDQVIAFCGTEITERQVREVLGIADRRILHDLTRAVLDGDGSGALSIIDDLYRFGMDLQKFAAEFVQHLRDLMVVKVCEDPGRLVDLPDGEVEAMAALVRDVHAARLHRLFNALLQGADEIGRSPYPKLVLEMALLRLCHQGTTLPLAEVLEGLARLEARIGDGPEGGPPSSADPSPGGGSHAAPARGALGASSSAGRPVGLASEAGQSAPAAAPRADVERDAPSAAPRADAERDAPAVALRVEAPSSRGLATPAPLHPEPPPGGTPPEPALQAVSAAPTLDAMGTPRPAPSAPRVDLPPGVSPPAEPRSAPAAASTSPAGAVVIELPRPKASSPPLAIDFSARSSDFSVAPPRLPRGQAAVAFALGLLAEVPPASETEAFEPSDEAQRSTPPVSLSVVPPPASSSGVPTPASSSAVPTPSALVERGLHAEAAASPAARAEPDPELAAETPPAALGARAVDLAAASTSSDPRRPVVQAQAASEPRPEVASVEDPILRLDRLLALAREADRFTTAHLEHAARLVSLDDQGLVLAVPEAELAPLRVAVPALAAALRAQTGRDLPVRLEPCVPGDARLAVETPAERRERLRRELIAARREAARRDPVIQEAVSVLGAEVISIDVAPR